MTGLDEFLELFGNIKLSTIVTLILAIIFMVLIYKKIKDYLVKKYESDKERDTQLKEALECVQKFTKLENDIMELKEAQKEHTERLVKMENDSKRRECNKLRDRIIQNYRYYVSEQHNPMKAWTRMESEAFWDLFGDYEDTGGDGYVHSEIQPAMNLLTIIEIENTEAITELMNSRR